MQAASAEKAPRTAGSTARKLALAGLVAVATTVMLAAWINSAIHSIFLAWDFPVFYIAARMPLGHLYDPAAFAAFWQQQLQPLGVVHWAPYVRPAVFAVLTRPLGLLPYRTAFLLWVVAGGCAYAACLLILIRRFDLPAFSVPAFVGYFPFAAGLVSGQDNCVFLLAVIAGWLLLEAERDWLAGIVFGCCLYKYNLILLVPLLLVLKRRFRALTSFVAVGAVLLAFSAALSSPRQYLDVLINIRKLVPDFSPVGLRGATAVAGIPWSYPLLVIAVLVTCIWLMRHLPLCEALCVAIVGMLLISPYVTWYDSTLLLLPISLLISRSDFTLRMLCILVLVLQQLWRSDRGPIEITPAIVGLVLLGYFFVLARRGRHKLIAGSSIATMTVSQSSPSLAGRLDSLWREPGVSSWLAQAVQEMEARGHEWLGDRLQEFRSK